MDWIEEEKKKNDSEDTAFLSSNDVVSSWIFNLAKPTVGNMILNYRNRIKEVTDDFAGNYSSHVTYQIPDYQTPQLIRQSLGSTKNKNLFRRVISG
jgi:hypothetical protein